MCLRLMVAMFDLPFTPTLEGIRTSPTVLLDPEIVGVAVGISLLSYIQAEITILHIYFRLRAAMFDLPVTPTSKSIRVCPIVLLDPENVGSPLKFLCHQLFKICYPSYRCFRYHIRHFNVRLNTADFQHGVTLSAAVVTLVLSKVSEVMLHSFPLVKYAS